MFYIFISEDVHDDCSYWNDNNIKLDKARETKLKPPQGPYQLNKSLHVNFLSKK